MKSTHSNGLCQSILTNDMGMHKVSAKFVSQLLCDDQNHHVTMCPKKKKIVLPFLHYNW